ncbi:hypothetical protein ACFWF3_33085, partial [Nocardia sp. NPDC060220]|uniref:hypothetical protein n=1 Tax=Nocardia sp. NPDC060220 TaxID=3347076 RepID=UPI0036685B2B
MSDPARYPTAHQGRTFHQLPARPQQSSGGWIVAAVLVIVGGMLGAVGVGAIGFFRMSDSVDRYQRVTVPGSGDPNLATGDYTVYFEYPGAATIEPPEAVRARLTDPTGQVVPTEAVSGEQWRRKNPEFRARAKAVGRKIRKQVLKDYVIHP